MTKKQDMGTRHPDVWGPVLASKDLACVNLAWVPI
jgi:hypothetical protein